MVCMVGSRSQVELHANAGGGQSEMEAVVLWNQLSQVSASRLVLLPVVQPGDLCPFVPAMSA